MKRGYAVLIIFLVFLSVCSFSFAERPEKKRAFILTVPKAGTHFLEKILYMIMGKNSLYFTNIDQDPWNPPFIPDSQFFIFNHVYPGFAMYRNTHPDKYNKVILIRDPRDAIVSLMMFMKTHHWGAWISKEVIENFRHLPEEMKLGHIISFPDEMLGLRVFFREAIEWMKDPSVLVVRFEDLVGPQGGGDRIVQEKTLRVLIKHLGFDLSEKKIAFIVDNAFGVGKKNLETFRTFRKGEIGTWSQYFTERDKELFKSVMGEELIQLGYETNYDW